MPPITAVSTAVLAAGEPAGGAAFDQVAIATGMASIATAALLWGIFGYRNGRGRLVRRAAALSERATGLPAWAALPAGVSGGSLLVALLGMYWDISLHIDQGRDPGPLANPAHYLILVGLYGVFAAGCLAVALPEDRPGPAAVRLTRDWYVPVGGILLLACGGFALVGFPLDDLWHRLFGQDVTLWGPTHLMLFGGAGLSLIAQAILLAEGMRARGVRGDRIGDTAWMVAVRRVGLMGGLLIGLSTFQGEFDFGVPQFRLIFHPMLVALSAGLALTAARIWIGRGGALASAVFFLVVRGLVGVIVGPVFGETFPVLPLYLVEAACVELVGMRYGRSRPLQLGAIGGLLCGTVGLAAEWGWTQLVFPLPWNGGILPEALIVAPIAGVAGGLVGALLGSGLRFELPPPRLSRGIALGALAAVAGLTAYGLSTTKPQNTALRARLTETQPAPNRFVDATVRVTPADAADDAAWMTATAWQGGGLHVDRLERVAEGVYRTTKPIPVHGDWKATFRLQKGREIAAAPIYLPRDAPLKAREVPASATIQRPFVADKQILQRESKQGVASWLWTAACLVVLTLALIFLGTLAWGLARVAGRGAGGDGAEPDEPRFSTGDRQARTLGSTPRVA